MARHIYCDEAGISAKEPASFVVGVIVHSDEQWRDFERRILALYDECVPAVYRKGFCFHGKDIFGNPNNKKTKFDGEIWSFEDRLTFFKRFLHLRAKCRIPIVLGMARRSIPPVPWQSLVDALGGYEKHDHFMAFLRFVEACDRYLKKHTGASEIASLVVEEHSEMRHILSKIPEIIRETKIPKYGFNQPDFDQAGQIIEKEFLTADRIIDCPLFAPKRGALFLQVADACAFAFRRHIACHKHGESLCIAMLGRAIPTEPYKIARSAGDFFYINPPGPVVRYETLGIRAQFGLTPFQNWPGLHQPQFHGLI